MTADKPSKSARKREQLALQELGEQLIGLGDDALADLPCDDRLRDALRDARTMRSHGALRRQRQLIGRLMRNNDAAAIRAWLSARTADDTRARRVFARAEAWRDRLVADGPAVLDELRAECGQADTGLEPLLAELRQTYDERREKFLRREIFRRVHALLAAAAG